MGFDAIGNGGWPLCYRLEGGMAACNRGTDSANQTDPTPHIVTWSNGSPITNVAHITGQGSIDGVIVVTEDGQAYKGTINNVSETPIITQGAISATGGYGSNSMCVLIENGDKKDLRCGSNFTRPSLPADFDVMQVTAAYGFMCALNRLGEVWCWTGGGGVPNLDSIIGATPAKIDFGGPMISVSAGQTSICGTKQSGGLVCKFSYYDARHLPAQQETNVAETPSSFHPTGKAMQAGYRAGLGINKDGSAVYYNDQSGAGKPLSIGNIVAGGGDRGAMGVLTTDGSIYLIAGGTPTKVALQSPATAASCRL